MEQRNRAEDELAALKQTSIMQEGFLNFACEQRDAALEELAALKGRRCDGCHWLGEVDSRGWNHCKKLGDWEPPDFACNRWTEK